MKKQLQGSRINSIVSNIELLRIIAMAMIVMHHLFLHGNIFENSVDNMSNLLTGGVILPGGKIGYDCFVVISAWFIAEKSFSGNRYIKIALEVVFYNIIGMILAAWLNDGYIEAITLRNFIGCFLPVFGISHGFAVYYLIFLMIVPLLQKASKDLSQKNIISIVLLLFMMEIGSKAISAVLGTERFVDLEIGLSTFIIIYFMAIYFQRWNLKITNNKLALTAIIILIWATFSGLRILNWIFPDVKLFSLVRAAVEGDISPLNIIVGFCMFFIFKGIRIKHSNFINFIASHTFGILLLHDHNYFRYVIWKRVFSAEKFYNVNTGILICYTIAVVIVIFTVGIAVDTLREYTLEKPLQKTKIYSKACGFMESCFKL